MSDEDRLAELAQYHVGLFTGATAAIGDASSPGIGHALFVLIEAARQRREQWLGQKDDQCESS